MEEEDFSFLRDAGPGLCGTLGGSLEIVTLAPGGAGITNGSICSFTSAVGAGSVFLRRFGAALGPSGITGGSSEIVTAVPGGAGITSGSICSFSSAAGAGAAFFRCLGVALGSSGITGGSSEIVTTASGGAGITSLPSGVVSGWTLFPHWEQKTALSGSCVPQKMQNLAIESLLPYAERYERMIQTASAVSIIASMSVMFKPFLFVWGTVLFSAITSEAVWESVIFSDPA